MAIVFALASCNSILGIEDVPYEPFRTAKEEPSNADAGAEPDAVSTPPPRDASQEQEREGGPGCSGFADSFERTEPAGGHWTPEIDGPGKLEIDRVSFFEGAASFKATLSLSNERRSATLTKTFPHPSRFALSFAMRASATAKSSLLTIQTSDGSVSLVANGVQYFVAAASGSVTLFQSESLVVTPSEWHRFVVSGEIGGVSSTVRWAVDDKPQGSRDVAILLAGELSIGLGASTSGGGQIEAWFDDLCFHIE